MQAPWLIAARKRTGTLRGNENNESDLLMHLEYHIEQHSTGLLERVDVSRLRRLV